MAAALQQELRQLDAGLPFTIQTWAREWTSLVSIAGGDDGTGCAGMLGAMLSMTGIFGMAAYSVSKRLRELGIRVALGAQRREVLRAALGRAFRLLAFGSAAGLVLGLLATKVCFRSSCIRRRRAIRWCWRGGAGHGAAGAGGGVDSGAARAGVDPLVLLREE